MRIDLTPHINYEGKSWPAIVIDKMATPLDWAAGRGKINIKNDCVTEVPLSDDEWKKNGYRIVGIAVLILETLTIVPLLATLIAKAVIVRWNKNARTAFDRYKNLTCFKMLANNSNETVFMLSENKHLQRFLNLPSTPGQIKDLITNALLRKSSNFPLNKSDLSFPFIASPSTHGLKKIAADYKKKYGIKIKVCKDYELKKLLQKLKQKGEITGVIIEDGNLIDVGHVTPILCDFSQGRTDVISLDVTGKEGSSQYPMCQEVEKLCKIKHWNYANSTRIRQASHHGCRTESLVVLRNALIDIQQNQKEKKGIGHDRLLVGPENEFIMPLEWDYHNQIRNPSLSEESTAMIRRYELSKHPSKRNKIQTVQEFRASHAKKVKTRFELVLSGETLNIASGKTKTGSTILKELLKLDPGNPPAFKIESNLSTLPEPIDESKLNISIIWEEEQVFNTYQVTKGYKYQKKIMTPPLKNEENDIK